MFKFINRIFNYIDKNISSKEYSSKLIIEKLSTNMKTLLILFFILLIYSIYIILKGNPQNFQEYIFIFIGICLVNCFDSLFLLYKLKQL